MQTIGDFYKVFEGTYDKDGNPLNGAGVEYFDETGKLFARGTIKNGQWDTCFCNMSFGEGDWFNGQICDGSYFTGVGKESSDKDGTWFEGTWEKGKLFSGKIQFGSKQPETYTESCRIGLK